MCRSVRGRRWLVHDTPPLDGLDPRRIPRVIARLLANRGIQATADAERFFRSHGSTADPTGLPGMEAMVRRILRAIADGERIAVFGDYDVDGVTATAILSDGMRALGADVITHLPDRFTDGYGLTRAGLRAVRDRGTRLVITVDCGINANDEVDYAAEIGLAVVILDHHEPPPTLPAAAAIVDPKIGGGPPEFDGLASCGLAFTTLRALYAAAGSSLDEARYLDLAALGTVADMVPLVGENRRLVRDGLEALRRTRRPGLAALAEGAGVDLARADASAIGFRLAPRLNAAGRLEHASLALDLLTTHDDARARDLAVHLNDLNARRQRLTEEGATLARRLAAEQGDDSPLIMVGDPRIAQGIVGLVASKLVEESYRPAIVYERGEDICRASFRSIPEFDVVRCLARGGDLMERWGGHAQAGGFTVRTDRVDRLKRVLSEWATAELRDRELQPALEADLETPLSGLSGAELKWLKFFEPCGQQNPTPIFVSRTVPVTKSWTVGADGRHLRLKLRDGPITWDAIGFNLGHAVPRPGSRVDVMYSVVPDRRNGLELQLQDFAPAE